MKQLLRKTLQSLRKLKSGKSLEKGALLIRKQAVNTALHYVSGSGLLYVSNAKVASSSIKKSIWMHHAPDTFDDAPHNRRASPFLHVLDNQQNEFQAIANAETFTVVRNPFKRIRSAYLDKIAGNMNGDHGSEVWTSFARRFGFEGKRAPDFSTFLELITTEHPSVLDQHFAPQYLTTLMPLVKYDHIGRIEDIGATWHFLGKHGIAKQDHRPHTTTERNANVPATFGPREIELVREYYEKDFEIFGYSEDPSETAPVRPVKPLCSNAQILFHYLNAAYARAHKQRDDHTAALCKAVPTINSDYLRLENHLATLKEIDVLRKQALKGELEDWPTISLLAQIDLRNNEIQTATRLLAAAQKFLITVDQLSNADEQNA